MSFRMPIKDAKGLGSAHHGTGHWWLQRLTALAMLPLMFWVVIGIAANTGAGYDAAIAWLAHPVNAVLMILLLGALFYHASLGLQVVLEDYVGHAGVRFAAIIAVKFAAIGLGTAGAFAVLIIALGD
jgi:succinate dehydrogenase / fumarate reductase membrane anchor subunit